MKKKTNNNINPTVSKQDIAKWKKKLTVKSKTTLKVLLISGISLIAIGGGVGGYFAYNNIKLQQEAKNKCTITFDTNGGSTINNVIVNKGQKIEKPDNPTKTGYSLINWCFDSACEQPVTFPLTINNSMTLYAKWDVAQFNVDFYLGASELIPYKTQSIAYNKTVEMPPEIPTKQGYKFAGWFTNKQSLEETSRFFFGPQGNQITSNVPVYAKWVEDNGTNKIVTYDFGKHQNYQFAALKDQLVPTEDYILNPTFTGFKFSEWRTDISDPQTKIEDIKTLVVNDDINLYAKWNKDGYSTVTFSYGDGKSFDIVSVKKGECISKPENPTYPGYVFENWYEKDMSTLFDFTKPITEEEVTVYAKWNEASWFVTKKEFQNSFRYLVDIEGTEKVTQKYITQGYCRKTTEKQGEQPVINFNITNLLVNDTLESCEVNPSLGNPYQYTKKENNFYVYASKDPSGAAYYEGIKEVNIRDQIGEVFSKIYDVYDYLQINVEHQSFNYKYKDEVYDIDTTMSFKLEDNVKKVDTIECTYIHTENKVTTTMDFYFKYNYVEPSIYFPEISYDEHIHTLKYHSQEKLYTENAIKANTTGDHTISTQENNTPVGLQVFRCYKDINGEKVATDFITEDVYIYRNNEQLKLNEDYEFKNDSNGIKVIYFYNPTILIEEKPESFNFLLHVNNAQENDIYFEFQQS